MGKPQTILELETKLKHLDKKNEVMDQKLALMEQKLKLQEQENISIPQFSLPAYESVKPVIDDTININETDSCDNMIKKIKSLLSILENQPEGQQLYTPTQIQQLKNAAKNLENETFKFIHDSSVISYFYPKETRNANIKEKTQECKAMLVNIFNNIADPVNHHRALKKAARNTTFKALGLIVGTFLAITGLVAAIYGAVSLNPIAMGVGLFGVVGGITICNQIARSSHLELSTAQVADIADKQHQKYRAMKK